MSDNKVCRPRADELAYAMHVASSAKRVCAAFIEKGRPDAKDFMELCADLDNLEGHIPGVVNFDDRAEDLMAANSNPSLWRERDEDDIP